MRESTKVYSILLGKRIRLSGGVEVTVYELVATAAGVELPGVKIGPDEANATLRRYGMKVKAARPVSDGKWLIQNTSHEVTRMFSDTPYAADWRGRLIRLDGADSHPKTEKFNGLPERCVSLPMSEILEGAPTPSPVEDDLPL